MEQTIKSYKCPCCGAPLAFDGKTQSLHCASCGNDFSTETLEQLSGAEQTAKSGSDYNWADYTPREFSEAEAESLAGYTCPSCGASVTGDSTLAATICPYCGNGVIVKEKFEGTLRPDLVLPFKVDKKGAVAAFEEDFKKRPFLPDAFKDKKKLQEMAGMYIPYWLFDCDCNADISYNAHRMTTWSDADYNYTKTDHFKLIRSGVLKFRRVPQDALKKADDNYTEALEPFDLNEAKEYNSAYLSGFLADTYDVSAKECETRANERIKKSTEDAFADTTNGFLSVVPEHTHIAFQDGKTRYAFLPVWMLNFKYEGENYKFAVNGQTGKVVGTYPVDKSKKWKYFAKVAGVCYVIAAIVAYFFLQ